MRVVWPMQRYHIWLLRLKHEVNTATMGRSGMRKTEALNLPHVRCLVGAENDRLCLRDKSFRILIPYFTHGLMKCYHSCVIVHAWAVTPRASAEVLNWNWNGNPFATLAAAYSSSSCQHKVQKLAQNLQSDGRLQQSG